jgi:hypothetical protein
LFPPGESGSAFSGHLRKLGKRELHPFTEDSLGFPIPTHKLLRVLLKHGKDMQWNLPKVNMDLDFSYEKSKFAVFQEYFRGP